MDDDMSHLFNIKKSLDTYRSIQGYYKRNRHFHCCSETKLLMI